MNAYRLPKALARLTRVPGVQGAVVVDREAGVPVVAELGPEVEVAALSAMAGALFARAGEAARGSGFGDLRVARLEAAGGQAVIADAGELLVVALTEPDAQLSLVRVQVKQVAGELSG